MASTWTGVDPGGDPAYFSLFVGDLPPEVHDHFLESFFRQYYPSVRSAKVMTDPFSGRSKGYGFVRFTMEPERDRAVAEMNGAYISSRTVRVSPATARRVDGGPALPGGGSRMPGAPPVPMTSAAAGAHGGVHGGGGGGGGGGGLSGDLDPHNTTLFIGGLTSMVAEDMLRAVFARYGEIAYAKIPPGKGCGFVQFVDRQAAEYAMQELNGHMVGGSAIRISWGKSQGKGGGGGGSYYGSASTSAYHGGGGGGYGGGGGGGYGGGGGGYGGGYDAYGGGGGYGSGYDAYGGGYGSYGSDAYSSYYGSGGYGASGSGAGASGGGGGGTGATSVFDPFATVNIEKLNAAYVQRHMPGYTGSYMGLVSS